MPQNTCRNADLEHFRQVVNSAGNASPSPGWGPPGLDSTMSTVDAALNGQYNSTLNATSSEGLVVCYTDCHCV